MSSPIKPQEYGQAILEHVQSGAYPESEKVISAELPSTALPEVSKLVEQAQEDVKTKIRQNSRNSAPDVDGWISQAKQLRDDIDKSRQIAREIVEQAQHGEVLEEQVNDAAVSSTINMTSLVEAMTQLDLFDEFLQQLCKDFESLILMPRLQVHADGSVSSLVIDDYEISVSGSSSDLSAQALFSDVDSIIEYLRSKLPPPVVEPLAGLLMPRLVSRLISTWLASAVPEELDGLEDFEDTMSLVQHFSVKLDTYGWPGKRELRDWTRSIPDIWLRKRQEISLDRVRRLLSQGLGTIETVERVETQKLSRNDEVFAGSGGGDGWDAGWSDEEGASQKKTTIPPDPKAGGQGEGEEEEDVSAWGLDDDKGDVTGQDEKNAVTADDDADAWGWGDEHEGEETHRHPQLTNQTPKKPKSNGIPDIPAEAEREVTLRETYSISLLPREILAIITQVVFDAERLETSDYAGSPINAAASNLLSLPGLILAMYRASASSSYARHPSGSMFLYNDTLWLTEQLQDLQPQHTTSSGARIQSRTAYNLKLDTHSLALETFGKRAYTKEMESQRTIITDLLDGAQGFSNCTEHPFNQECDIAIASTVDRLRNLNREWKGVLSQSALFQSLGSLLSTMTNKIIVDVEDMSDISEPESQQLTTYCNRIAALEDLFQPTTTTSTSPADPGQNEGHDPPIPLTALYTPHWLKFQYLANILESSLVDIKYLWTEGELGLEFDTEEVVDLIVALFADSPHRRNAVAEIRRRRGVR
ncbi:protein transport protein DSL1/ZW10, partial [Lecanoromycetidae sp. Uapishka_2]